MPTDDLADVIATARNDIRADAEDGYEWSAFPHAFLTAILDAAEAGLRAREEIEALKHDIARHVAAVAAERDAALEEAAKVADQLVFDEVALTGTNDRTKGLRLLASRIRALKEKP